MKSLTWIAMGAFLGIGAGASAQTPYDYQGVPAGGPIRASQVVAATFPFTAAGDQVSSTEATAAEYAQAQADDAAEWVTTDPGNGNEMFIQCDMLIAEPRAAVTQIDFTFVGFSERSGGPPGKNISHEIWVLKAGTSPFVAANWVQAGTMIISEGTVTTFTASLTTTLTDYIDAATGAIRWGVYSTESSAPVHVDYLRMTVTAPRGYGLAPRGVIGYGVQDVAGGATAPQAITLTNTGGGTLGVTSVSLTGADAGQFVIQSDSGQTSLGAGQSRTINVAFDPNSSGAKTAALQINTNSGSEPTAKVILTGAGGKGEISVAPPGPIDFGLWEINAGPTAPAQVVTIGNTGNAPITITSVSLVSGDSTEFAITNVPAIGALQPGATTTANIVFNPTTTGPKITALRVVSNDLETPNADVILKGMAGKGEVAVSPIGPINFGSRELSAGPTASITFTISNAGTAQLTLTSVTLIGGDAGQFTITSPATPGLMLPFAFTTVSVAFDPTTNGPKTVSLRVSTNDAETPTVDITLTGTGFTTTATPSPSPTPTPSALDCYSTEGAVPGGPVAVSVADVNDFPYNGAGSLNSSSVVAARDYATLSAVDGSELVTIDPGNNDEIFLQIDMIVVEPISTITQLQLVFTGYTEVSGGAPGQSVTHDIYVLRTGTDPLVMSNWVLVTSGSITEGASSTLTGTISANFSQYIDAATGAIRWGVYTQQSSDSMYVDAVQTKVTATLDFDVSPRGLLAFGYQDINDGPTAGKVITITNTAAATLNITSISLIDPDAAQFVIQADTGQLSLAQNQTRSVTVAFDPSTIGQKNARLRIASNSPNQPTFDVRLTGAGGKREINVSPSGLLNFGNQEINLGPTLAPVTINITNAGTSPLSLASVVLAGTNVDDFPLTPPTTPALLYPGEVVSAVVNFDPRAVGGRAATLTFNSNDLETPAVIVNLQGTGTKAEITVSPVGPIDFGTRDVNLGATATQPITIMNNGNGPLLVTGVALVGVDAPHFLNAGTAPPFQINPAGSSIVNASFDPSTIGLKLASVQVLSNDQESPISGVGLRGEGTGTLASPTPSLTPTVSPTISPSPTCGNCTPVNASKDWASYE